MMPPLRLLFLGIAASAALAAGAWARQPALYGDPDDARAALARALSEQKAAELRGRRLEQSAAKARQSAERTAAQAAALAARIQQSEAGLAAAEARLQLIERQRTAVRARLAERQRPLVQLTAALQNLSRRPPALSLLRPVSVREMVYLRAILASTLPEVTRRTAGLRKEVARLKTLQAQGRSTVLALRKGGAELDERRRQLAALESRQRLDSRAKSGIAAREADRALAMSEEARDLNGLLAGLEGAARLRAKLAALPGPVMRPVHPEQSQRAEADGEAIFGPVRGSPEDYQLPALGRVVAGFGAVTAPGIRSNGITLAPRPAAQIVAPGAGRVAFAGPYRGYGRIVILEHEGGWTSLVTGLARVDVEVGETVLGGSPLGIAGVDRPTVTLELRRAGETVNPLEYL